MLWSLFLTDPDFSELHAKKDPDACSDSVKKQLVATKLAEVSEEIDGDHYQLKPAFTDFLNDPDAQRLRAVCKGVLDSNPAMKWFFEDIRDAGRLKMVNLFLTGIRSGKFKNCLYLHWKGNPSGEYPIIELGPLIS